MEKRMTALTSVRWKELAAIRAFVERNFSLMRRYLAWEIVFLFYTVVNCFIIGLIGAGDPRKTLYLVIGAVMWGFLSLMFHDVSESVAWERWEGTIEYTFMAPIRRATHLLGQSSFAALYGMGRSMLILVVAALFFGLSFETANMPAAVVALAAGSLSFLGLGLMGAVLPLLSPEKGAQATHIVQAVVLLLSGVYYEIEVLPSWLAPLAKLCPGTYALRSVRGAILDGATLGDLKWDLLILLVSGAILIPAGLLVFRFAEQWAKRNGKLKRNG
ncbi:MAG: ABC transporter permease [Planctomycetota bacterium]|jgi:ABC-2 type transport system permease protein